jgi:ribosomal protein S2
MASSTPLPAALNATEEDIQMLISAQCHIGSKNCEKAMEPYVFKRRADGEYLVLCLKCRIRKEGGLFE